MKEPVQYCTLFALVILFLSHLTFPQIHIQEKIQFNQVISDGSTPLNFIWCLFQDSRGFIWIGTSDGLTRYDGLKFKTFKNSLIDTNSISSNTIRTIIEDKSGIIWVGTGGGGLNKYNYAKENFTRYVNNSNDSTSISNNYIYSIIEDRSGAFWIGTDEGLNIFNRETEKFFQYKNIPGDSESLSSNVVTAVFEDSKSNLWIGTIDGGLNKFDRTKKKFARYFNDPNNPKSLSHDKITCICEDSFGNIWISTLGGGINKIVFKDDSVVFKNFKHEPNSNTSLCDNDVASIYIDKNNVMWLGTWGGGLSRRSLSNKKKSNLSFISYSHNPDDPSGLKSNNISCFLQDNSGVLWIGTWGGGLQVSNLKRKQFGHYKHEPDNPFSLSANGVMSVLEDKAGIIWIGTWDGGLNRWDRVTNIFTHYKNDPNNPLSLSDNTVSAIYEDRNNILWIGTWDGGLNKFDRASGKFYHFRHNPRIPTSISDDRILSIIEDEEGAIWIGTYYGGLNKFDRKNESFSHFIYNSNIPQCISSKDVHELLIDKSRNLWIGTKRGGLDVLDLNKMKFTYYKNVKGDYNSLSNDKISALYEDKSGALWIGTQDGGLSKFNSETGKFKSFKMQDGLPSDFIMGILEDDNSNLWISTSNGLSKFNIQTESFRNYYVEDGLQSNEFEELNACYKSRSGELIFGGINGFNIFYPDSIKDNTHIPSVYITYFNLFNKPIPVGYDSLSKRIVLHKSIIETKELELNYDDNVFSFEFAALDYQAPIKNKYAYKMEGFDKDWIYTSANRNLATYTNLDPGEYTFRVKGSNSDGYWNEKGASIIITILPPWWRTNLAYLIYFILIGTTIYFIWKSQLRRSKLKNEYAMSRFEAQKLQEVDELKTRFFTNISHEFRTPLTLILGPAKRIMEKSIDEESKSDADFIQRNAKKLNKLVDELLDISKIESGEIKLKASPLNINSAVKEITMSFHSLAERKKIQFNLATEENEIIVYVDRRKLDKIISNVLTNAFKFTPEDGSVDVGIHIHSEPVSGSHFTVVASSEKRISIPTKSGRDDQFVEISIRDTGIGIPADQIDKIFDRFYQVDSGHTREHEGTGIGLALTKELVELHKGKIEVESEEGKGTTFRIFFPLGKEHLPPEQIFKQDVDMDISKTIFTEFDEPVENHFEKQIENKLSEKPILLIVEDNADARKYVETILESQYKIYEATDGEEGFTKALEYIPDLIISDIMMPKMDGFQLCHKLKTDSGTSHIPVIMLTAKATMEDKISGFETGADMYITKPFEAEELKARIKNLLEQRKRLHEHFQKFGLVELDKKNITSVDQKFLEKVLTVINEHISDTSFGVETLAENMSVSRSLLFRKLEALTDESPIELIRRTRLNKAAILIKKNSDNISQIALEVGFNNPSYFAECFKKQFGVAPSQYKHNVS